MKVIIYCLAALLCINLVLCSHVKVEVNVNSGKSHHNHKNTEPHKKDPLIIKGAGEASLLVGQHLDGDQCIVSSNQQYKACMQSDCNFVIYTQNNSPLWHTHTPGAGSGCHLDIQTDNNMVLYDGNWKALWNSGSNDKGAHGTAYLVMQDDGNLVLYQGYTPATPIWDAWSANGGAWGAQPQPQQPTTGYCFNRDSMNLVENFEGYRANFYYDAVGVKTIGYGTACNSHDCSQIRQPMSQAVAEQWLLGDMKNKYGKCIRDNTKVKINNNQYGALASFVYNLGCGAYTSDIMHYINNRDFSGAVAQMQLYRTAGGRVLQGLVTRRAAERDLFNKKALSECVG